MVARRPLNDTARPPRPGEPDSTRCTGLAACVRNYCGTLPEEGRQLHTNERQFAQLLALNLVTKRAGRQILAPKLASASFPPVSLCTLELGPRVGPVDVLEDSCPIASNHKTAFKRFALENQVVGSTIPD
jgi:hypothetical protein